MDDIKTLLPIEEYGAKQLVNARMLHRFLGVQTRFNDWITRRIKEGRFIEDRDFVIMYSKMSTVIESKDYGLTMRMAEHICMLERTQEGEEARDFFIECERKVMVHKIPTTLPEALRLAAEIEEKRIEAEKKLAIAAPKARDFDVTMAAFGAVGMDVAANIINHPHLGRTNLFRFLRNEKILKTGTHPTVRNTPFAKYSHHFKVVLKRCGSGSHDETRSVTLVKASGISFIIGRIERAHGRWDGSPSKKEIETQIEKSKGKS